MQGIKSVLINATENELKSKELPKLLNDLEQNKKPLKTVWPICKAATEFEKID